jgi:hypothetical protein
VRGHARLGGQLRRLGGQLALEGVARVLGGVQVGLELGHLLGQGRHAREVVLVGHAREAEILELEFLQPVLGRGELGLVLGDLLVDELGGVFGVALLPHRARAHEQLHEVLDQALGALRVDVAVADRVQVAGARRLDLDLAHQQGDLGFTVGGHGEADLGHVEQALDVGARDEGARQHAHLLVHVGLHDQAGHQGLQDGLGVDVDLGVGLVAVGHHRDHHHEGDAHGPCDQHADPAPAPDLAAQAFHEISHSLHAGFHGRDFFKNSIVVGSALRGCPPCSRASVTSRCAGRCGRWRGGSPSRRLAGGRNASLLRHRRLKEGKVSGLGAFRGLADRACPAGRRTPLVRNNPHSHAGTEECK